MSDKPALLIIDDEEDIGEILSVFLEDDFDCDCILDPTEAVKAAQEKPYQIVITDLEMPDLDGIQVINELKKAGIKAPILISSGHDKTHPKIQSAMEAGAEGVLTKPFMDPEAVVSIVKGFLK